MGTFYVSATSFTLETYTWVFWTSTFHSQKDHYARLRRKTVPSSEKTVLCDSFSQTDRFKTEFRVLNGDLDEGWYAVHVIRLNSS